jgi:hypothetical protein
VRFQYAIRRNSPVEEQRDRELEDYLAATLGDGSWTAPLRLGGYYLWVDSTGDFRIESSTPTSDTDGTVVGTQS